MSIRLFAIAIALILPIGSPVEALVNEAKQPQAAGADPNEKICESIPVIGSRLAKRKVCATRAEWAERKRLDREAVDQAQKQVGGPCTTVANRNTGGISC
jgi:hypothetical protein